MLSRRSFLAGSLSAALALQGGRPAAARAVLTEDGLYREPWFREEQAFRDCLGAQGLPLLQGDAPGEFRQARDR